MNTLQSRFDHFPFGAVHHDGDAGDVGLCSNQVEEPAHGFRGVEEALVHVDVEDLRAALDLFSGDFDGLFETVLFDQAQEFPAAGDVCALADIDKVGVGGHKKRL